MKRIAWLAVCTLTLMAFANSALADGPDPGTIHIKKLSWAGSGCAPGTAVADLSNDAMAFTLIFSEFLAQIGPDIPLSEARKNCQVNVLLHVPQGFTFAVFAADYRGFANLARGAKGMQKAIYYFQGDSPQSSSWRTFRGAMDNDWQLHDELDEAFLVWSPCGVSRSLNINTQVRLEKGTASSSSSSIMTMDSEDLSIRQVFHIRWRRCTR